MNENCCRDDDPSASEERGAVSVRLVATLCLVVALGTSPVVGVAVAAGTHDATDDGSERRQPALTAPSQPAQLEPGVSVGQTDTGALEVTVSAAAINSSGAPTVTVNVTGSDGSVSRELQPRDPSGSPYRYVLALETLASNSVGSLDSVRIALRTANGSLGTTTRNLRSGALAATTLRSTDSATVIDSPLLVAGRSYRVTLRTENPSGVYANTHDAERGRIVVSNAAIGSAETVRATVLTANGTVVFDRVRLTRGSATPRRANVTAPRSIDIEGLEGVSAEWLLIDAAGGVYTVENLTVTNGTITLNGTPYALNPGAGYQFVVAGADERVIRAQSGGQTGRVSTDTGSPTAQKGGVDLPLVGRLRLSLVELLLVGLVLIAFPVGGGVRYWKSDDPPASAETGATETGGLDDPTPIETDGTPGKTVPKRTVAVTIVDEITGDPVSLDATAMAKSAGNGERYKAAFRNGTADLSLPEGEACKLVVKSESQGKTRTIVDPSETQVSISIPPKTWTVSVESDRGSPLDGATVRAFGNEYQVERETNSAGQVTLEVPRSVREPELRVMADDYESEVVELSRRSNPVDISLAPLTGDIEGVVRIDGATPAGSVDVVLAAVDGLAHERQRKNERRQSDENGRVTFEEMPVGTYELRVDVNRGDAFSQSPVEVVVRPDRTVSETLRVDFEFELTPDQRARLNDLRGRVDRLSDTKRRDVAIPRYLGSAVAPALDAVSDFSDCGDRFVTLDAAPSATVDATLDAVDDALSAIESAMGTRDVLDLFSRCADLPDRNVTWQGGTTATEIVDAIKRGADLDSLRLAVDRVRTRIDTEDVASPMPAVATVDHVESALVDDASQRDRTEMAVRAVVGQELLDAVERLYEDDELRERLEQSKF
jgi:hypothetical protein